MKVSLGDICTGTPTVDACALLLINPSVETAAMFALVEVIVDDHAIVEVAAIVVDADIDVAETPWKVDAPPTVSVHPIIVAGLMYI